MSDKSSTKLLLLLLQPLMTDPGFVLLSYCLICTVVDCLI